MDDLAPPSSQRWATASQAIKAVMQNMLVESWAFLLQCGAWGSLYKHWNKSTTKLPESHLFEISQLQMLGKSSRFLDPKKLKIHCRSTLWCLACSRTEYRFPTESLVTNIYCYFFVTMTCIVGRPAQGDEWQSNAVYSAVLFTMHILHNIFFTYKNTSSNYLTYLQWG